LSFGRLRSLLLLPLVFASLLLMTGCGSLGSVLPLLTGGGGPNVAANTQLGAENAQNVGVTTTIRPTLRVSKGNTGTVRQDVNEKKVENQAGGSVTINEIDPLVFLTLIGAFLLWSYFLYRLPSPDQIWKKKK